MTVGRVSQVPVEVLRTNLGVKGQVSQVPVEVLRPNATVLTGVDVPLLAFTQTLPSQNAGYGYSAPLLSMAQVLYAPAIGPTNIGVPALAFTQVLPDAYEGQSYSIQVLAYVETLHAPTYVYFHQVPLLGFSFDLLVIFDEAPTLFFTSELHAPEFTIGNNIEAPLTFEQELFAPKVEPPLFMFNQQLLVPGVEVTVTVPPLNFSFDLLDTSFDPPRLVFSQVLYVPTIVSSTSAIAGSGFLMH